MRRNARRGGGVHEPGLRPARRLLDARQQALVPSARRVHLTLQELGLDGTLADVADDRPLRLDRLREQRLLLLRGLEIGADGVGERLLRRPQLATERVDLPLGARRGWGAFAGVRALRRGLLVPSARRRVASGAS